FHESMNLAQLWRVPVVFVCENNRWSESTPQSQHQPVQNLTQRAAAYGMRASHVDGQDVEAVHLAALEALTHARAGDGPVFLLCETERLTGHYIGDPQVYRDKDEIRKLRESTARRRRVARVREGRHRPEPRRRAQERLRGAVRRPQATRLRRREEKPMERVAIVARLQEGSETRAAEIIAEGAPFDLAETGFVRHSVYLSASEVVFVFEGLQVDSPLTGLVDDRPYPMGPALDQWRAIVDGPPRIARERFGWKRDVAEPLATDLAVGGGKWT
ncbi:MAG: thiamine pyrophosphate-dependent enzyme, partial [Gaiellaceae bacterium]